jgi:hypothetical protein
MRSKTKPSKAVEAAPGKEFRMVVEDISNQLRSAEAAVLTSIEALAVVKPHVAEVLRLGANVLTAAIGDLDRAVDTARLVGTNLIVPPREGGAR